MDVSWVIVNAVPVEVENQADVVTLPLAATVERVPAETLAVATALR